MTTHFSRFVITADTHPDHDTICTFRRENRPRLSERFVKVLQMAQTVKVLKFGQITVSADGTKVLANASKHAAVSYERAGERIQQLELKVQQLIQKAEQADATPLEDGLTVPEEIVRRQERQAALAKARVEIEARAAVRYAAELAEHEKKMAERQARKDRGQQVGGKAQAPPSPEPKPSEQYHFTDPESRIMKAGSGEHFEQAYNAQAAVEVESRLIVGQRVSLTSNDKQERVPTVAAIPAEAGSVAAGPLDSRWGRLHPRASSELWEHSRLERRTR